MAILSTYPTRVLTKIAGVDVSGNVGLRVTGIREILTANRQYYVRKDGSDSNDGLTNSAGGAFLTIGKAAGVAAGLIDGGGGWNVNVTVLGLPSTYTENLFLSDLVGGPFVNFTASGTVIIDGGHSVEGGGPFQWSFSGFKFQNSGSGDCWNIDGGWLFLTTSTWGAATGGCHVNVHNFGVCYQLGNDTISGGAQKHWNCESGGLIRHRSATITLTGTPAFSTAFASADHFGDMQIDNITFSGSATGNRVLLQAGGRMKTGTQDLAYLPGSLRGTFSGGFYEGIVAYCYPITVGPRTITAATDTLTTTDYSLICNRAGTVTLTLPNAPTYSGRWITVKTITANTVVSAGSDVVPLVGGAASTPILGAVAGRWANLQSDGTNWIIMAGN